MLLTILQISCVAIGVYSTFYLIHAIRKQDHERAVSFGLVILLFLIIVLLMERLIFGN